MASSSDEEFAYSVQQDTPDSSKAILVTEDTFVCLKNMHSVHGFFFGNLMGKPDDTVADTPEQLDYPALARVVSGLLQVVAGLAGVVPAAVVPTHGQTH